MKNKKGYILIGTLLSISIASMLSYILYTQTITTKQNIDASLHNNTKQILIGVKAQLINQQADPDNDGKPELLKETNTYELPPSLIGVKTDGWGRTLVYCSWDLAPGINTNPNYSQRTTTAPIANLIGRVISKGLDGILQTDCLTATNKLGDDLITDIYLGDALYSKLYSGTNISEATRGYNSVIYSPTEPSEKIIGLLWTNPSTNITQIWTGNTWVKIEATYAN